MSTILVLAKLEDGTGNKTTAERIAFQLQIDSGMKTMLCDVADFNDAKEFSEYANRNEVSAILAIHAYRAGKLLKESKIPFALIFGGTDLQSKSWDENQQSIMADAVARAKFLIAFSDAMKFRALQFWPFINEDSVYVQSQGVTTSSESYDFEDLFKDNGKEYTIENGIHPKIFLFVGGIRPVKDPLFLLDTFAALHQENTSIYYVIIGPKLDAEYAERCQKNVDSLDGVFMFDQIPRERVHSLISQAFALVNSSTNEGMAGAILEAMDIGTPVIARNNSGNCSLIKDNVNGMLFEEVQGFHEKVKLLMKNEILRGKLIQNAKTFVETNHNSATERKLYNDIVRKLLTKTPKLSYK